MKLKLFAVTAVILVSVATIWALTRPPKVDTKIHYTLTAIEDGKPVVYQYKDRIQKANGDWQERTTVLNKDGEALTVTTMYGINGKGTFKVRYDTHELEYIGGRPTGYHPPKPKMTDPGVLGEGSIAGEHVIRKSLMDGEVYTNDDGIPLKTVLDGTTIEATSVEHGKFELDPLPDWPINYGAFNSKNEKLKAAKK